MDAQDRGPSVVVDDHFGTRVSAALCADSSATIEGLESGGDVLCQSSTSGLVC